MKHLLNLLFVILAASMFSCFQIETDADRYVSPPADPSKQPPKELIDRDSKQISKTFIAIAEKYRYNFILHHKWNYTATNWIFSWYASREKCTQSDTEISTYVPSPLPVSTQIKVTVDTLLYNKDKKLCFVLLAVEDKHTHFDGLVDDPEDEKFNGFAFVGYRQDINQPFALYPIETFMVSAESLSVTNQYMRYYYFTQYCDMAGAPTTVFFGLQHVNLDDPQFFKKSPLFRKDIEGFYNFQCYKDSGKIHIYHFEEADSSEIFGKIDYHDYITSQHK